VEKKKEKGRGGGTLCRYGKVAEGKNLTKPFGKEKIRENREGGPGGWRETP